MGEKIYKIRPENILPLATGRGACLATDMITVEGLPVAFLYRQEPAHNDDSGWRFTSGMEPDEYLADPANLGLFDVNVIANLDAEVIPLLDAPIGSAFGRDPSTGHFVPVPPPPAEG